MKTFYALISLLFGALMLHAQPRYVVTDIGGSSQAVRGTAFQTMLSARVRATVNAAAGVGNWAFVGGNDPYFTTAASGDTATWQPMRRNQTLAGFAQIVAPNLQQASAIVQRNRGGYVGKLPAVTSGRYYTFNVAAATTAQLGYDMAVLETTFAPIRLDTLTLEAACWKVLPPSVSASVEQNNIIKAKVAYAAAPNTAQGEKVYIAYSTDGSTTFNIEEMTTGATSAEFTFPNTMPLRRIYCYAFTSAVPLATLLANNTKAYLFSLSAHMNTLRTTTKIEDRYYSFIVAAPRTTNITYSPGLYSSCIAAVTASADKGIRLTAGNIVGATYVWTRANGIVGTTTDNFDIIGNVRLDTLTVDVPQNGVYTVSATTATGCISTGSFTIAFNPLLTAERTQFTSPGNCGAQTGTIIYTGVGGVPPYTYAWGAGSPLTYGEPSGSILVGPGGSSHNVTVTDATGCTVASSNVVVANATIPAIDQIKITHIKCKGDENGQIALRIKGGSPFAAAPFYTLTWKATNPSTISTVTWTGNATTGYTFTTPTPGNLKAGNYDVTVTGSGGCRDFIRVTVLEAPTLPTVTLRQAPSCYKNGTINNGLLKALPTGGAPNKVHNNPTPAYTYAWSAYPNTGTRRDTLRNLQYGGCYTVTATDAYGCTASSSACIDSSSFMLTATALTAPTCFAGTNGSAQVNYPSNQKANFLSRYTWDNGASSDIVTNITSGLHTVFATFANACLSEPASVNIGDNNSLLNFTLAASPSNGYQCANDRNGTLSVSNVQGGTPPYNYAWEADARALSYNSPNIDNIRGNAVYIVTVTGSSNCRATRSIVIAAPNTAVTPSAIFAPVRCKGENNGTVRVVLANNIANAAYQWYDNNTLNSSVTTADRSNVLPGGVYGVIVTDPATGCKGYADAFIDEPASQLLASASVSRNVLCFGGNTGRACITASGGAGNYKYRWNAIRDSVCINDLEVGTYTPTVTDQNGCSVTTAPITITGPNAPLVVSLLIRNKVCGLAPNGILCVNTVQNASRPYTYLWNDTAAQTDSCASGLVTGGYRVTVTDRNGCTASAALSLSSVNLTLVTRDTSIESGKNLIPNVVCNLDADLLNSVNWSPTTGVSNANELVPTLSPTVTTPYIITISKDGCTITDTLTVTVRGKDGFRIAIPTGFAPNSGGVAANDNFFPLFNPQFITITNLIVFNKWGQKVYEGNAAPGWDGSFQGTAQPAGGYVYLLEYKELDGTVQQTSGDIILVR